MQESGLTEIIPFTCISVIWGQYPMFFSSWAPSELTIGSGGSLMVARSQVFFSFLSALRAHQLILEGCNVTGRIGREDSISRFYVVNPLKFSRNPPQDDAILPSHHFPCSPLPASALLCSFLRIQIELGGGWARLMASVISAGGMSHPASRGASLWLQPVTRACLHKQEGMSPVLCGSLSLREPVTVVKSTQMFCSLHLFSLTPVSFFPPFYTVCSQWACYSDEMVKVDPLCSRTASLSSHSEF